MSKSTIVPLETFLIDNDDINFIRFEWLDLSGVLRVRVVAIFHALRLEATDCEISLQPAALWSTYAGIPDLAPSAGDARLFPDWQSLSRLPCLPGHASVICNVYENYNDVGFKRCPRSLLIRRLEAAPSLDFLVGFEIEFVLISPETPSAPVAHTPGWSSASGLRNKYQGIIESSVLRMQAAGIGVEQYHSEGAQGMFEIVLAAMVPVTAVDALIRAEEIIRTTASERNTLATMYPKPTQRGNNVGQHIHLSISPLIEEQYFLAGILHNIPVLCAFTMPSYDSYTRVKDLGRTIGTWVSWGTQLRDVPIRRISAGHWEVRAADATANMYLALAALIECGLQGLRQQRPLICQDLDISPAKLCQEEREKRGILQRLPQSLEQSLRILERDGSHLCGEHIIGKFLDLKKEEIYVFSNMTEEQRREVCVGFF